MSKLSNLECIKAAWAMGWSATLKSLTDNDVVVVSPNKDWSRIAIRDINGDVHFWHTFNDKESLLITGYLYAGELAGNEPIPEGQKFKVKKTGEVLPLENAVKHAVTLKREKHPWLVILSKDKIEPVFT